MSDDKLREEMTEKYWDEQILRGELYAREQEVAELRADLALAVNTLTVVSIMTTESVTRQFVDDRLTKLKEHKDK